MEKRILVLGCIFWAMVGLAMGADVKSRLDEAAKTHPRLFIDSMANDNLKGKLKSDKLLKQASRHVIEIADALERVVPVERRLEGRRLLGVSRTCLKRVLYLSQAYRLTGDKVYAKRAEKEMLSAAAFIDWNPSHFLDVAEMTAALAIGYDWLFHELDSEARQTIKAAILEKGLKTSLKGGGWVSNKNNWNQVCHGGLTLGALALLEDEPELAEFIVERAIENVPNAMGEYAPDGAYPEGPSYWNYGTSYNVLLVDALETVLGTDFGLTEAKGFMESSDYYLYTTGPSGLYFNYSDCGLMGGVSPAMYWFAAMRQEPWLLWQERKKLSEFLKLDHQAGSSSDRLFPLLLNWAQVQKKFPSPSVLHWKADGVNPISIHRSGWKSNDDVYLALKAGSPGVNHGHMDVGSFVLEGDGVRWAVDLGSQNYHSLESLGISLWDKKQDGQRWEIFRYGNSSHNTLVVNGQKQRIKGYAPIIAYSEMGPMPFTIIDQTTVYDGQLASAKRGVGLRKDGSVLIQDEIKSANQSSSIRWGMVTVAEVDIVTAASAVLRQDGEQLGFRILEPKNARIKIHETARPPNSYDAPNPGTKMIGFTVDIPSSTSERLVVQLSPGNRSRGIGAVSPLSEW